MKKLISSAGRWLAAGFMASLAMAQNPAEPRLLEDFLQPGLWRVIAPPGPTLALSGASVGSPPALRMAYDLGTAPAYVVATRDLQASFPDHFELSFSIRGQGPRNNLEFKVNDSEGNTFMKVWKNLRVSEEGETLTVTRRDLRYAWGPNPKARLKNIKSLELALTSGRGGQGVLEIGPIQLVETPPPPPQPAPVVRASSQSDTMFGPENAFDESHATRWSSRSFDPQWIEVDYGRTQDVAGVRLYWILYGAYEVKTSADGQTWTPACRQEHPDGGLDELFFSARPVRFLRIDSLRSYCRDGYSLSEIELIRPEEAPILSASSEVDNGKAAQAMDGKQETQWQSGSAGDQWLQVDLRGEKATGGLYLHWGDGQAKTYRVELSTNGLNWWSVYEAKDQPGTVHKIYLKETEARFIRIACRQSAAPGGYAIREIELKAPEEEMTLTRFYRIAAAGNPGCYPRWLSNEQAYWNIVGTPEDILEGAICEDGTLEPHKRGFTLMPLLRVGGELITRNQAAVSQELLEDCLPIPTVEWKHGGLQLRITTFAAGGEKSTQLARYTLANHGTAPVSGELFLVLHPIQVYPPWQEGHNGFSPIRSVAYEQGLLTLDKDRRITFSPAPSRAAAKGGTYGVGRPVEGTIADDIARGAWPSAQQAEDPEGFASAAVAYNFQLAPGETTRFEVRIPLHPDSPELAAGFDPLLASTAAYWREAVNRVTLGIPDPAFVNTVKANIAYNLITKDGPGFQPGSRSYDKAWMRDGSAAAIAMLEMGFRDEVREFIEWFAAYQFDTGEIPPIIDNKHEDPLWEEKQGLQEFDSQGQFINLVREYYAYTRDVSFLVRMYPRVVHALEFLQALRERRDTDEYRNDPEKQVFHNILPESRSHEGYWLAHSYWDNFWALKGWKDGIELAHSMGDETRIPWMRREYETLQKGVYDTIQRVMKKYGIEYIPGCAEKGDFDATSTAAAIVYCEELENMPQPQTRQTFDRYYKDLAARLVPGAQFVYTPYEARSVLAFLFMGQKDRALQLTHFLLACRRPSAWGHLAEVVHSDPRFPCYIGDMPHTWVGSEFIHAARGLLLFERGQSLVLGAGIDPKWLGQEDGLFLRNAPTRFGLIHLEMKKTGNTVLVRIAGDARPPDGFRLHSPLDQEPVAVTINGQQAKPAREIHVDKLPAEVVLRYP